MLSDERIAEIAETYIGRLKDIGHKSGLVIRTDAELACESAIRNALAEAAVRSQFKPGERGQVVEIAAQVPVVGEPVGFILIHENGGRNLTFHDNTDDLADGWSQHKLIIQPTTSITAQELYALRKDAERYRYLRKQHWSEAEICVVTNPKDAIKLGCYCPSSVRLDNAIDAAIAQGKGE